MKTFEDLMVLVEPFLPKNEDHVQITDKLKAYRSERRYLSIELDKIGVNLHITSSKDYEKSDFFESFYRQVKTEIGRKKNEDTAD